ncbi:MAG: hypothetical protein LBC74_03090 [Planctomycetaceae bacterium]|nr:hypothetical protein [Planctomycetaceae bacterium]
MVSYRLAKRSNIIFHHRRLLTYIGKQAFTILSAEFIIRTVYFVSFHSIVFLVETQCIASLRNDVIEYISIKKHAAE